MIKLAENTIDKKDIKQLIKWLKTDPYLTMNSITAEFEKQFAEWIGVNHCIYVNSGSSANLLMVYALILDNRLKNKKIVVPSVCWATTVAPVLQFGLEPIICDVDMDNLGCDLESLELIFQKQKPAALMLVNVLGFPNKIDKIIELCNKHNVVLLEDSCETMGTSINGKKCGTFGLMGSFSWFYGHIGSTIEGGMIITKSNRLIDILKMIREHGWTRRLDKSSQEHYKNFYNISDFNNLFTFYFPGFNVRPTDIQAKIGLEQMKKIDMFCKKRYINFLTYQQCIKNPYWNPCVYGDMIVNMGYPVIHPDRDKIVAELIKNDIEVRPLVCGAMSRQPFIKNLNIKCYDKHSDIIHDYGFYVPNHPYLKEKDIKKICDIINTLVAL